ncbi:MAG: chemotaxis protein CheB, partial [Polyangiaceae bacterium]
APKKSKRPAVAPPPPVEERASSSPKGPAAFPIVGIGASAGGLEALELFFRHVPPNSGVAYVVIQHLDPTHKGAMVELLQRTTKMTVVEVKDRQKVAPGCVYVIPPNKEMSILHGVLHLMPQPAPRGLNLPIDSFFRSLAVDQGDRSIGVVLSGMGSDGTAGLAAIKEKAGTTFVQSVKTAKFSGMPGSAIEGGHADVVADAAELPARILAYLRHAPYLGKPEAPLEEKQLSALEKIFILLRSHTGSDFTLYKRSTLYRRIERRMGLHQIETIASYVRLLRENPREIDLLNKELLIGVTSFFRDGAVWEHLRDDALPLLLGARAPQAVVRAWVPGCSTGEEAYSLAIILSEAIAEAGDRNLRFQIFATDVDRDAVERARQGVYSPSIEADVSPERLRRYFVTDERGYRVRKEIREAVVFAPQNLILEPPFTKLDVLSCRNVLIYLSAELQKKLIPLFHYALNTGGVLLLGSAETVGAYSGLFASIDGKTRLYRRLESALGAPQVDFPPTFVGVTAAAASNESPEPAEGTRGPVTSLVTVADRLILQRYAPSAILTTEKGDILYISGRTGKYLEPAAGKANLNVFAMAREGLRYELSAAFSAAMREDGPITVRAVKVLTDGLAQSVDLTVQRLVEPKELGGTVLVVIADVPTPLSPKVAAKGRRAATDGRLAELERELQHSREELQTTREEMQTSQEELKSTNEELQSTNEELQSTN